MDPTLAWTIAGFVLVITELMTGTFYLLVLGVGAFAGAGLSFAGTPLWAQATGAGVIAIAGAYWVHAVRANRTGTQMASLDAGQPVVLESWINEAAGHARVRYRDATWEAYLADPSAGGMPATGATLYITSMDGNVLKLARTRPV